MIVRHLFREPRRKISLRLGVATFVICDGRYFCEPPYEDSFRNHHVDAFVAATRERTNLYLKRIGDAERSAIQAGPCHNVPA